MDSGQPQYGKWAKRLLPLALLFLVLFNVGGSRDFARSAVDYVLDLFRKPTPRDLYLRNAKRNDLFPTTTLEAWTAAFTNAENQELTVELPHREVGRTAEALATGVRSYRFYVPVGRVLRAYAAVEEGDGPLFGELFYLEGAKSPPVHKAEAAWSITENQLYYEPFEGSGEHLLLMLQVPPGTTLDFDLTVLTEPILDFPVRGVGNSAIQSFWGAPRDGGARSHEGNDIFAPRGTPLLAVTDGRISRVREGGIGGKTVWLDDGEGRNLRYYYAHLDEWRVRQGDLVRRGDVVGTVGNTGNARTTPPHLHFGVYAGRARDPYPYIRTADEWPDEPRPPRAFTGFIPDRGAHFLRSTPEREGAVIRELRNGEAVTELGYSDGFFRILTQEGESGYWRP